MKYLLLYNPVSGKGKFYKKIPYIKDYFKNKGLELDIYSSKSPKDLEDKATFFSSKYDVFLVSGGDGTINEVVNGLMRVSKRPSLAVLPSGTANDVAAILGISKKIKKTLDIITTTKPVAMDVNLLNDRYFLYTTAAGILTKISYDIPRSKVKKFGYFAYLSEGAKDIMKNYRMKMNVVHDKGEISGEFMLVLGLSSRRVGGFFLKNFSRPKLDDGKFELRLIRSRKFFKLTKLASFFLFGGRKGKTDVQLESSYYKISTSSDIVWNTDGEKACVGEVEITVMKKQINVYVSKKSRKKFFNIND